MNLQKYIESGTLELYAMGALSAREQERTASQIAAQPELYAELKAISRVLEQLAPIKGSQPDPRVREQLLLSLESRLRNTFDTLYYGKYKRKEAAEKLNLSLDELQQRARQAVQHIRELLEARKRKS